MWVVSSDYPLPGYQARKVQQFPLITQTPIQPMSECDPLVGT